MVTVVKEYYSDLDELITSLDKTINRAWRSRLNELKQALIEHIQRLSGTELISKGKVYNLVVRYTNYEGISNAS